MYYPNPVVASFKSLQESMVDVDPAKPRALVTRLSLGFFDRNEKVAKREVRLVGCAVEHRITETA